MKVGENMETSKKELDMQFQTFTENFEKFSEAGNKAAGTRARKALAEIGKLTKAIRKQIQEAKNNESK
jgi:septation ring formation regulator EzrA